MFWKKKEDKVSAELINVLKLIEVNIVKLDARMDAMEIKLRKKLNLSSGGAVRHSESSEAKTESSLYNDGFDEIRKINKEDGQKID